MRKRTGGKVENPGDPGDQITKLPDIRDRLAIEARQAPALNAERDAARQRLEARRQRAEEEQTNLDALPVRREETMEELLRAYSPNGFVPSPRDSGTPSPRGTSGGSKLRRIRKLTGGYKDPNTNLNTNVPVLGAPLTREQLGMRQTTQTVAATAPTRLQNDNTNSTRVVPSNIANAAAGISKKTRRTRRRKRTTRRKRTRRTRSKK
jgi:hypothetical protein